MAYQKEKLPELCPDDGVKFTPDLDGLIKWLETQEPDAEYDYGNCDGECLISQFVKAIAGRTFSFQAAEKFLGQDHFGDDRFNPLIAAKSPRSFGAALLRARAARKHLERKP